MKTKVVLSNNGRFCLSCTKDSKMLMLELIDEKGRTVDFWENADLLRKMEQGFLNDYFSTHKEELRGLFEKAKKEGILFN